MMQDYKVCMTTLSLPLRAFFCFCTFQIRTNSVNPTVVLTEMGKAHWGGERGEAMKKKIPMKKFVGMRDVPFFPAFEIRHMISFFLLPETSDVVDAIVFLLSDKSAMVNGVIMPIDGGLIISC